MGITTPQNADVGFIDSLSKRLQPTYDDYTKANIFKNQVKANLRRMYLTHYKLTELLKLKLYLLHNDTMGFGIASDGEIVNLFNNSLDKRNMGKALISMAIAKGGYKTFCYEGKVSRMFEGLGFREVLRAKWNNNLMPKDWNKKQDGTPDVVWLTLDASQLD